MPTQMTVAALTVMLIIACTDRTLVARTSPGQSADTADAFQVATDDEPIAVTFAGFNERESGVREGAEADGDIDAAHPERSRLMNTPRSDRAPYTDFAEGTWTFQTYGTAAFGDSGKGDMYTGHMGAGYHVRDNVSINLEGFGAVIRSGIDDEGIAGGADLLLRWHFLTDEEQRFSIYLDGGGGIQQASTNFSGIHHFNFRLQFGFGGTLRISDRLRLMGGGRYLHISDAGISGTSGGFDGPMLYMGIMIPF